MSNLKDLDEIEDKIICRCEEITEREIREAIRVFDLETVTDVKRVTRAGMGLCQGSTCESSIKRILNEEIGDNTVSKSSRSIRPPIKPLSIDKLVKGRESDC